jgi:putative transposase
MPYGLKRFQKAEALHFITFSCFHRLPLLDAPGARETVEAVLEPTRARHQARVYAYVLMPEHVHLLINEPPAILVAQFIKAVKQMTSRKLRGQREKFWQERYFDRNVRGEDARSEVIRYIHRNPGSPAHELCALGWKPVKRGLVASPGDYQWSSFNHYATGVRGAVEIESEWMASLRGPLIAIGPR